MKLIALGEVQSYSTPLAGVTSCSDPDRIDGRRSPRVRQKRRLNGAN